MADIKASILFPYAGRADYAGLALASIQEYSSQTLGLVITVEPFVQGKDREWVASVPAFWPGPVKLIYNKQRRGAYGSTNEAARQCPTDIAIWFTSDQVASPGWDAELLKWLAPNRFVTGRVIDSGALLAADRTILKRFGSSPDTFKKKAYLRFCREWAPDCEIDLPRHYIPMAFYKEDFFRAGLFTEGKDTMSIRTVRSDFEFFMKCYDEGFELVEAQRCLTYHFGCGSKRTKTALSGLLNWVYPFGLRPVHRMFTGYVALIDALEGKGARKRLERLRASLKDEGSRGPNGTT
ncbi:MAG: glycosyltransferase [Kiritimatiellae bacterium]|nr:glycosyltransferase [Kiritimatiellia bacterium]